VITYTFGQDTLAIPAGWDCFLFKGWLWRRTADGERFYRERWLGNVVETEINPYE
jgi:hypothetical protein